MTQVHDIRKMYFEEGKSITEISRETGHDRKTIRMYIQKEDWNDNEPKPIPEAEFPKLTPFKDDIDEWLTEDKKAKRKQIAACCKELRLSRNIVEMSEKIQAASHQEYLIKLLRSELEHRESLRKDKLLKNAGFYSLKSFENFRNQ